MTFMKTNSAQIRRPSLEVVVREVVKKEIVVREVAVREGERPLTMIEELMAAEDARFLKRLDAAIVISELFKI